MKDLINTIEEKDLPELNKFEWQDPLLLDTKLSDNERLLAKSRYLSIMVGLEQTIFLMV